MSMTGGGGMMGMGDMPEMYNLVVNTNNEMVGSILAEEDESTRNQMIQEGVDLALLSQNLLQGEALTNFVNRAFDGLKHNKR